LLKKLQYPRNQYNLYVSYFNERKAVLTLNSRQEQRVISKGCPQGSASGPGFWNIQFNSLLNLEYSKNTKVIAYADDLLILTKGKTQVEVENYANIETQKVTAWARENKMIFNERKSKLMIITRRRPKMKRDYKIYLNNKQLCQENTIKYLGIIIDKRFNFNEHIEYMTAKCIKFIHALSKSAKVNWGLRHDVLRIIYSGAILPLLSYGTPVWIESLQRNRNASKLKRVQRLINIKIAKAYRTTSHEALCVLTGITPIMIELENVAQMYHITRKKGQEGAYDAPKDFREWPHPAEAIELKDKRNDMNYMIEIYTDGSKSEIGVGSGIAIFIGGSLTFQLRYKLAEKCSNNQAEQLAIVKALGKVRHLHKLQRSQRTLALHTDSRITLEAIANPSNHHNLVELIRDEIRTLEKESWTVHFTWVKAHDNIYGNELADHLAKLAASDDTLDISYSKVPKSAVNSELEESGLLKWQRDWDYSSKGALTKSFFPNIKDRLTKRLNMCLNLSTIVTGHGKLKAYLHRFKIIDNPMCPCKMNPQTTDHLIRECPLLNKQRQRLKNNITRAGGRWPIPNYELANKHTYLLLKFVNSINFENLQ
jgi:ribonuclease HI